MWELFDGLHAIKDISDATKVTPDGVRKFMRLAEAKGAVTPNKGGSFFFPERNFD